MALLRDASAPAQSTTAFVIRLTAGFLLVNLFVIGLTWVLLDHSRQQEKKRAAITGENLAHSIGLNVASIVGRADLAVLAVVDEAEKQLAAGGIDATAMNAFIARQRERVPELQGIRMSDAQGDARYGTGVTPNSRVNYADRDYFIKLRDDPKTGLYLAKPLFGRIPQKWVINVTRRVNYPDGSFAGVAYGSLPLEMFTTLFTTFDVGPHGAISLLDRDGAIMARFPEPHGYGSTIGHSPSQISKNLIESGKTSGTLNALSEVDNIVRTISFRKISGYPLFAVVSLAPDDYLATWRGDVAKMYGLVTLFIIVTMLTSGLIFRNWNRVKRATDELLAAKGELEKRVAERTEDLFKINIQLGNELTERKRTAKALRDQTVILKAEAAARVITQNELAGKQLQLEELNRSLTQRVDEAVFELRQKDQMLIQHSRLAAMGEMVNNIAHQWRQPLNNIGLIVQDLAMSYDTGRLTDQDLHNGVNNAMELIHFMSRTIDDFRNFFRKDKEKSEFIVNDIAAKTIEFLSPSLKSLAMEIEMEEEKQGIKAMGYVNEYSQVLLNLITNAKDAVADRKIPDPFIRVRIFTENNRSVVTVTDNGGGIDDTVLPKVFDPYFTTKGPGKSTGIGLYMSKVIVEKNMSGIISARNIDGGAEFRIEV